MFTIPVSIDAVFNEAQKVALYENLIAQIIKDFGLVQLKLRISDKTKPEKLKEKLFVQILELIENDFGKYLNLLYVIDVSEEIVKKLDGTDRAQLAEQIVFLILKREWQKVWFRKFY